MSKKILENTKSDVNESVSGEISYGSMSESLRYTREPLSGALTCNEPIDVPEGIPHGVASHDDCIVFIDDVAFLYIELSDDAYDPHVDCGEDVVAEYIANCINRDRGVR